MVAVVVPYQTAVEKWWKDTKTGTLNFPSIFIRSLEGSMFSLHVNHLLAVFASLPRMHECRPFGLAIWRFMQDRRIESFYTE